MRTETLMHRPETKTITDLVNLFEDGLLNLEPGFQRQSVWSLRDRAKLMESILRNYPLPAVFFYRREDGGHIYYDVIDGKQRIESILMFMGEMRGRYATRVQLPGSDRPEEVDWRSLTRRRKQHLVNGYRIPVIEVDGDLGDIIDVFVRINSTGKALTPQERRHARYYNSEFLREADRVARRFEDKLKRNGVFTATQTARMKHIELVCELMLSMHHDDVINRKSALDKVMSAQSFTPAQIRQASKRTVGALNRVLRMFPRLKTSRLRQLTDFYSLVVLIASLERGGAILTDGRRNRLAWDLLSAFAVEVDEVREAQKKARGIGPDRESARSYLLTVSQTSDDVNQRRKRQGILSDLIASIFARKDEQRGFSVEQRRILWNSTQQRKCRKCGKPVTWEDFSADHIDPHSRGGRTRLENAAILHRRCNSSKRDRRLRR